MKKLKSSIILFSLIAGAYQASAQNLFSKLYFPGIAGIRFPVQKKIFTYSNGLSVNTAIEYRPDSKIPVFVRFNFDAASTKYNSTIDKLPVNVVNGTLHTNNFIIGAGYRYKRRRTGIYFLLQPGINVSSFNRVAGIISKGYTVEQISIRRFGIKYSSGLEYYLAEHFALVFEPAYYQNNINSNKGLAAISQFSVNVGFTTTLF